MKQYDKTTSTDRLDTMPTLEPSHPPTRPINLAYNTINVKDEWSYKKRHDVTGSVTHRLRTL